MLSPLLFTLLNHDCTAKFSSNHLADDTSVVGLISNKDERHYREEVCFRRCIVQSTLGMAPLNLCFNILFYVFLLSLFTRITSALFIYDRRTLLDIGHHCTNLLQDTLSTDPAWPLEILRTTEVNKGRLNNPRRRRKHRGRRAGIRNRLRKRAHSPPLPSILLANVQS